MTEKEFIHKFCDLMWNEDGRNNGTWFLENMKKKSLKEIVDYLQTHTSIIFDELHKLSTKYKKLKKKRGKR